MISSFCNKFIVIVVLSFVYKNVICENDNTQTISSLQNPLTATAVIASLGVIVLSRFKLQIYIKFAKINSKFPKNK